MGTYGVSMPFTPPNPWLPPHATNTPSDGTRKQHVNHLETAATLIPRHHHQHRNLCCGQLLRQQTRHQGDLENCLVLFTHIDRAARTTETVHVLQQTLRPGRGGGPGCLGRKRVFHVCFPCFLLFLFLYGRRQTAELFLENIGSGGSLVFGRGRAWRVEPRARRSCCLVGPVDAQYGEASPETSQKRPGDVNVMGYKIFEEVGGRDGMSSWSSSDGGSWIGRRGVILEMPER